MSDLDFFFNPSSVAVIGASDSVGSIGYEIMKNMLDSFKGEVYAVNLKQRPVFGKICYKNILEVPKEVDMAVSCTCGHCWKCT